MGVEEALMAVQKTVEDGPYAYGKQVYHKEWQQPCPKDKLLPIKVREECQKGFPIQVGHQNQRQEDEGLVGNKQGKQAFGGFRIIAVYEAAEEWDDGGVDGTFGKDLSEVVGYVEGEVDHIGCAA